MSSDNSQKLYFFSDDGYLNVIEISSKQYEQLLPANISNQTPFWLNDSELAIWSGRDIPVINIESNTTRTIDGSNYKYVDSVSDISNSNKVVVKWGEIFSIASFNDDGRLKPQSGLGLDASNYREMFCMRWKPDNSMIALIVVGLLEGGYMIDLPPDLAILRIGPSEKPIIIKKQVDGCISWSPDGKYIAYGNGKPRWNDLDLAQGIYYVDVTSGSVVQLTNTNGYYPVWSPDGSTIAFITENGISIIDVRTKEEAQIYSGNIEALLWGK